MRRTRSQEGKWVGVKDRHRNKKWEKGNFLNPRVKRKIRMNWWSNGRESTALQLHLCCLKNNPCDLWELQSITDSTKTENIRRWQEQCSGTSMHDLSTTDCYKYDLTLIETWFKRVSRKQMLDSYFYNTHHMNGFENLLVKMAPACISVCVSSKRLIKTVHIHKNKHNSAYKPQPDMRNWKKQWMSNECPIARSEYFDS